MPGKFPFFGFQNPCPFPCCLSLFLQLVYSNGRQRILPLHHAAPTRRPSLSACTFRSGSRTSLTYRPQPKARIILTPPIRFCHVKILEPKRAGQIRSAATTTGQLPVNHPHALKYPVQGFELVNCVIITSNLDLE